ncbi:MAG: DUF1295 domain-containing protein [Bacteroidales bacterium]|nr:DUF1295 domain-containing protein [Bacteroidales bacterium]
MKADYSKGVSIAIITGIYIIAAAAGVFVFKRSVAVMPEVLALLLADIAATVVTWGFGLVYENVSVYDPYWSVIPPVVFTIWAFYKACWTLPVILLLVAVWYWGIRLTGNWAHTFKGLAHEDWRYTKYRESQPGLFFHLINFFGLNMMPTLLVFACMLPGLGLFEADAPANLLTFLGFVVCLFSATIQLVADTQAQRFRLANPGQVCNVGLWKHGRHPNYFGEVQMWWGVWLMYASLCGFDWLILAPIAMTALFLFISIPLMESRQLQNKPAYAEYRKNTRILI